MKVTTKKQHLNLLTKSIILASLGVPALAVSADADIENIIVTSTKRTTSIMDVPYNVSATTAEALEKKGIVDFSKLAQSVPGLAYTDTGGRDSGINSGLIIRGLNTSSSGFTDLATVAAPTVSVYVDETPLFYNVILKDIERVEVLRGPQGTLYGSGSLGGTIRYISKKPNVDETEFEFHTRGSKTDGAGNINSDTHLVLNVPLNDNMAIRAVGGYIERAGFIDANRLYAYDDNNQPIAVDPNDPNSPNKEFSKKDSNDETIKHLKLSWRWLVNDDISVTASHQIQQDEFGDRQVANDQHTDGGDYISLQRIRETSERELSLSSLEIEADLGFATLTSATSSFESESDLNGDLSAEYYNKGYWGDYYYNGFPRESIIGEYDKDVKTFSQEIRLSSNGDDNLSWIAGAFYSKQELGVSNEDFHRGFYNWQDDNNGYFAEQVRTLNDLGEKNDLFYASYQEVEATDKALFGELSYQLTDKWQVTGGARFFKTSFANSIENRSPLFGAWNSDDGVDPRGVYGGDNSSDISDHIFKFNTSYDISDDVMAYVTLAEGFRNGGSNGIPTSGPWAEPENLVNYTNDTALSLEIGAKGYALDRKLRFNVAAYRIDWDDVILTTSSPNGGFTILTNGKTASSQGLELEGHYSITEDLNITAGYAYTDAKLTADFSTDGINGVDGDKLPGVPENMVTLAVNYFQYIDGLEVSYHLNGSYTDEVTTAFSTDTDNFTHVDSYTMLNASVFIKLNDNLSVNLFVDNITNERAPTNTRGSKFAALDATKRDIYSYVARPLTVGLGLKYTY
ncbi:TonB-dependent receptor [Colwellia sp. PAMC 21821]|uniref:TonB-dependent receptor n=1 Tax=Colwellia sp. PAMC 21821 TaxID=1816219 RepID=UPI0009BEF73D|nr:TonB-dependent receptor [Colwellia sp. PAMC 21821]ARD43851.1 hypothetical protein A3Q33_05710 [Colwellia sp. PAMC 21821]